MSTLGKARRVLTARRIAGTLGLGLLSAVASQAQSQSCRCPGGTTFQPGLVNYKGNSDRELVIRIEAKDNEGEARCEAAWIRYSEVFVKGTPYGFHLERKHVRTIREDACGESPASYVSRTKTYRFALDSDFQSLGEMYPSSEENGTPRPDGASKDKSNENVWNSIEINTPSEKPKTSKPATPRASVPEFVRTAWVLARRDTEGHFVALVRGVDQRERIMPLNKTRAIRAGEIGQIEASNGQKAVVRFYAGSRNEKLASRKNAFRRWYDNIGGPYSETKDDLFSALRACILEVPLDDIIEVNDYMDGQKTDQT